MNTRKNFLNWINTFENPLISSIDHSNFLSINKKDYVFNILEKLLDSNDNLKSIIADYYQLEIQRYHVFETARINEKLAMEQINSAILFCSKSDDKKRHSLFKMNLSISNYLAKSSYLWNFDYPDHMEQRNTHYFFIPSFLPIAPKEISLTGFDSVLLDIIKYEERFTYQELFELMKNTLDINHGELDEVLFKFMQIQILYYGTILPVN